MRRRVRALGLKSQSLLLRAGPRPEILTTSTSRLSIASSHSLLSLRVLHRLAVCLRVIIVPPVPGRSLEHIIVPGLQQPSFASELINCPVDHTTHPGSYTLLDLYRYINLSPTQLRHTLIQHAQYTVTHHNGLPLCRKPRRSSNYPSSSQRLP